MKCVLIIGCLFLAVQSNAQRPLPGQGTASYSAQLARTVAGSYLSPDDAGPSANVNGLPGASLALPKVVNRHITFLAQGNPAGFHLDEQPDDGVAFWPGTNLANGTIELDIRGKDLVQKSFVGVAFHGLDETTYDVVYFRPFNFRATDETRRKHAVQYVSLPAYNWQRLRSERPDQYEKPIAPPPAPEEWFHVRIVLANPTISVFVNHAAEPCLKVNQLNDRKSGWVGLYVGNGSEGDFANLKVTALVPAAGGTKP